ncbi:MAG TPA: SLC13 family permease [Blastocatellia bacterium]|nr:SLC13 family permease [Blastocatellia bacterium]
MSIHIVGVSGLVLILLLGTLRPINLGSLSLAMTFLVGAIFVGENAKEIYSGFPVELLALIAGVTYLFAIAENNGTVGRVVEGTARLVQSRRALIPWGVFVIAALPSMAGAIGTAGVALLAPIALRLARSHDIDRRMVGLMVVHGSACGNFSPLNALSAIVTQAVARNGIQMSSTALFLSNLAYNIILAAVIYLVFGGLRLKRREMKKTPTAPANEQVEPRAPGLRVDQLCTLLAILAVAVAAFVFGHSIGLVAFTAAAAIHLIFPSSSGEADKKIAWGVVLLVCGIVTYVAALQRYGTIEAAGHGIAGLSAPLVTGLLLCVIGATTSAFASSAGILSALIPLAVPLMARGDIDATGLVIALAISTTVVDATPFSTVGALVVANAEDEERTRIYRGLLLWGAAMVVTAPLLTWLIFILPAA